jgi:hypothetical protein
MHQIPGGYHKGNKYKTLAGILKNVMPASFFLHFVRYPFDTLEITAKVCFELVSGLLWINCCSFIAKKKIPSFPCHGIFQFHHVLKLATKCVLKPHHVCFVVCFMCFHLLSIDLFQLVLVLVKYLKH